MNFIYSVEYIGHPSFKIDWFFSSRKKAADYILHLAYTSFIDPSKLKITSHVLK